MQNCEDEVRKLLSYATAINYKSNLDQYSLDLISLLYKDISTESTFKLIDKLCEISTKTPEITNAILQIFCTLNKDDEIKTYLQKLPSIIGCTNSELSMLISKCIELQKLHPESLTLPILQTLSQFSFNQQQLEDIQIIISTGFYGIDPHEWPDLIQNILRGELLVNTNNICPMIRNQLIELEFIESIEIIQKMCFCMTFINKFYNSYVHEILCVDEWHYCDLFLILLFLKDNEYVEHMKQLIIKGWNNDYFNIDILQQFINDIVEINDEQYGQPLLNFIEIILFHDSTKNESKYNVIHSFPILYNKFHQIQICILRDLFNILSAQSKSLSKNAKYTSVQILEELYDKCDISRYYDAFESYFINEIDLNSTDSSIILLFIKLFSKLINLDRNSNIMIFIEKVLKTKYPDYQIMWTVLSLCIEKSKEIKKAEDYSTPTNLMNMANYLSLILKSCPLYITNQICLFLTSNILSINTENSSLLMNNYKQIKMLLETYEIERKNDVAVNTSPSFNIEKYFSYIKNYIISTMSSNDSSLYIYNSISPNAILQFYIMTNYLNSNVLIPFSKKESSIVIVETNKNKTKKGNTVCDVYWKSLLTYDIFVTITNLEDSLDISIISKSSNNNKIELLNKYYQDVLQCKNNYEKIKSKINNKSEKYLLNCYYKHIQLVRLELLKNTFTAIIRIGGDEIYNYNSVHYYCIVQLYSHFERLKERYIFIPSKHLKNIFNKIIYEETLKYIVIFIKNSVEMLERRRSSNDNSFCKEISNILQTYFQLFINIFSFKDEISKEYKDDFMKCFSDALKTINLTIFEYFESILTLSDGFTVTDSTIATFIMHIFFLLHDNEEAKKKKCIENSIKVILTVFPLSIDNLYMQFPVFSIIKYQNMLSAIRRFNYCYYLFQNASLLLDNGKISDYYGLIIGIKQFLDEFVKNKENVKTNKKYKLSNVKSNPISEDTIFSFITLFEIVILYSIDQYQPSMINITENHYNTPYDELISIINDLLSFLAIIQCEPLYNEIAVEARQSFYTNISFILINQVDRIDNWRNSPEYDESIYTMKSKECFEKVLEPIYKVYDVIIIQCEKEKVKKSLTTINMYFQLLKNICKRNNIQLNITGLSTPINKEKTRIVRRDTLIMSESDSADEEYSEDSEGNDLEE